MTDKEAIDNLKNYIECLMEDYGYYKDIVEFRDSVEHLEKSLQTHQAKIEKKDKMIDLMAEWLYEDDTSFGYGNLKDVNTSEKIKQYFERKVENEN